MPANRWLHKKREKRGLLMESRAHCSNSAGKGEAEVEKIREVLKLICRYKLRTNWKQQSSII